MSTTSPWDSLKQRVAGKWQLPLLALSALLLVGSFLRLRPSPAQLPLDEAVEYLDALIAGGWYDRAETLCTALLARSDDREASCAAVHLRLARALVGRAKMQGGRSAKIGAQIVQHYTYAADHAQPLAPEDFRRLGEAYAWQSQFARALDQFARALREGVEKPLTLRRHALSVMWDHPEVRPDVPPEELLQRLAHLRGDAASERLDIAFWAMEKELELLDALDRLDEAWTLLESQRNVFAGTDFADGFAYREAWLRYRRGEFAEAERRLRAVRNQVEKQDLVYAMSGWLLGRVVMENVEPPRPREALSFFESVVRFYAATPYGVASRIGSAEALVMLGRHDEAIETFRVAIEELGALADPSPVDRGAVRALLGTTAEAQRQVGRLEPAVEYAQLAVSLIDPGNVEQSTAFLSQLGQLEMQYAGELERASGPDAARARSLFSEAASTYLQLTRLNALNDRIAPEANWQAAQLFARAGQTERAIELLTAFVAERPHDSLVPRALLRLGDLYRKLGNVSTAAAAYRTCYRQFPRTMEGARALVPLARCYLAMGPEQEALAEETLRIVLEGSEVFTPQAPDFADAEFLLGEVLIRREAYERAIATLEEALMRYPNHPRAGEGRFLLADAYRKSALRLEARMRDVPSSDDLEAMREAATTRFHSARTLYRAFIEEQESKNAGEIGALEALHLQQAHFYEADCYYETQEYRQALKLYERAAGRYRETPHALAAYVQIINCYVFLSEPQEARAALARALVMVDAVPDEAFRRSVSPETRKGWKRYFRWLQQAELF